MEKSSSDISHATDISDDVSRDSRHSESEEVAGKNTLKSTADGSSEGTTSANNGHQMQSGNMPEGATGEASDRPPDAASTPAETTRPNTGVTDNSDVVSMVDDR